MPAAELVDLQAQPRATHQSAFAFLVLLLQIRDDVRIGQRRRVPGARPSRYPGAGGACDFAGSRFRRSALKKTIIGARVAGLLGGEISQFLSELVVCLWPSRKVPNAAAPALEMRPTDDRRLPRRDARPGDSTSIVPMRWPATLEHHQLTEDPE
jgi:hypothetical protein